MTNDDGLNEAGWGLFLAEFRAWWLGHCSWNPKLSAVALNRQQWERTCEWCRAHVGMAYTTANEDRTIEQLQSQFQWDADLGGSSE